MRPYELMIIFDSTVEDAAVSATIDRLRTYVTSKQGTVGQVDTWGRRRFAYELQHKWEGYYVLVEFSATPDTIAEIDRTMSLQDDVLRHKVVRLPDSVAGRSKPTTQPEPAAAGSAARTGA